MSEGTKRLTHASKAGEMALTSTSAAGQIRIRQELQTINKDFEELHLQLTKVCFQLILFCNYKKRSESNAQHIFQLIIKI